MKTLILIRHAKSDWPEDTEDFDRPLAETGVENALKMARHLIDNHIQIDKFITSPALRTLNTCKIFNQCYLIDMETNKKLYNPNESNFESVIYDLPDDVTSVALFSHNNGISNFANTMSDQVLSLPTCGVAGFTLNCDSWSEFDQASKKLSFYFEPKNL
ncbi:phosphohistidine phosphatase [Chryseobacterium sp. 6424]|uniref:SixA phosphatase family protein n=1 Tax=Chryseobacterium sp. 6424 TaxID=2039166 RepID=UPI000EFAF8DA|nr:histidine phosphatase family protein [Chryseobacterium sp. 6424]AYO58161.1 phosphohistidine phosphatase [Chryseobacterium sp. 6424]